MSARFLATDVLQSRDEPSRPVRLWPAFSSSVEAVATMADDKDQQFTRMWNEENKSKRAKFRNLMEAKLDVLHVEETEENARAFWDGRLAVRQPQRSSQMPERA